MRNRFLIILTLGGGLVFCTLTLPSVGQDAPTTLAPGSAEAQGDSRPSALPGRRSAEHRLRRAILEGSTGLGLGGR